MDTSRLKPGSKIVDETGRVYTISTVLESLPEIYKKSYPPNYWGKSPYYLVTYRKQGQTKELLLKDSDLNYISFEGNPNPVRLLEDIKVLSLTTAKDLLEEYNKSSKTIVIDKREV